MPIKSGTARLAICLPSLGFVVKLPIPKPIQFFKCLKGYIWMARKLNDWSKVKRALWLDEENDTVGNIRYTLLNGTYQNWNEYRLWKRTHSPFLEPTYFSLFGLVNIQRYGKELDVSDVTLWSQILDLSEETAWSNSHHFANPANFSFRDGTIRMFDYGGRGVEEVIIKYGESIVQNFDPTKKPTWEK